MPKKLILLLSIFFIPINSLNAQTEFGKYAGEFMAIGIGGRALGMGGAFVEWVTTAPCHRPNAGERQ